MDGWTFFAFNKKEIFWGRPLFHYLNVAFIHVHVHWGMLIINIFIIDKARHFFRQ